MGSQQQNFQHNGGPGGYPPLNQGYSAWDGQDHGGRRTWGCWEGEQGSYGQQAYGQQGYGHHYYGGRVPFMGWDRAGASLHCSAGVALEFVDRALRRYSNAILPCNPAAEATLGHAAAYDAS